MANEVEDISQSNHLLSLKWNNHSSNFKVAIASLQEKAVLSDATIACDDHLFPVHKLVLSTCSDFFARVFSSTPCKHPVIVLHDLPHQNFAYLLSYMYAGEVNVPQTHLPTLIKAAETLQIKGLAAPDEEPAQGFLSAINGHSERESSLEKSYSKLKKRKCLTSDNTGNSSNQGSLTEVEDNLVSSAKRSKKFNTNESNRRESGLSSISENDHAPSTEGKSAQTSHDRVKNEHSCITAVSQDDSYEEQGVQIKEEEECGDQDEEDDDEGAVSQMWVEQQQSAQVNWSNEGSSNDLSWLPFPASRDRLGDGNESKLSSYPSSGNHPSDAALQNSVQYSSGTMHQHAHASDADITSALTGGMLSTSSLGSAAFGASDAEQLLSSVGRIEAFGSHGNFMSLSPSAVDRAGYRKTLSTPRNSSIGSPGRGITSRDTAYRYRDKYSRTNGDGSVPSGHAISGSMTRSIMSLGNIGSSLTHDCPICLKHFQSRADVVRHMRTHTGERPFKCPHCEYSAALKGNLKSHILSRHPDVLGNIDFILRNISPSK